MQTCPKYQSAVFFVEDIERSKRFYVDVLCQKIVMDFGANVGFEGGLSIWKKDYALNVIFQEKAKHTPVGANNAEVYFECANVEALLERLTKAGSRIIHPVIEHPWGQRAFRVYDPDGHILEFAEPMSEVVLRLHKEGLDIDAIAGKSMMPLEFIKSILQIN